MIVAQSLSLTPLLAGMPSLELSDLAKLRLDSISFFLVVLLLSAAGVRLLWNAVRRDVPTLPQLSYRGALAGTVLWGLLFLIVLTMISGARELLTPGAWKKQGLTYALSDDSESDPAADNSASGQIGPAKRRERLELLRSMLWAYAAAHQGKFPETVETSGIADELWQQPTFPAARYQYHPGCEIGGNAIPVVVEFDVHGDGQMKLLSDGSIVPPAVSHN